jgi:hypothetical protein
MMPLQNCTNSENVSVGPYGETCTASHEVSDSQEEEDPVPITFRKIKAEPEVSCMCTVRQISQICRSDSCLFHLHLVIVHKVHWIFMVRADTTKQLPSATMETLKQYTTSTLNLVTQHISVCAHETAPLCC